MGKQELLPQYNKKESSPVIRIKTIEQINKEILWGEDTKNVVGFGVTLSIKARKVMVAFPDKYSWQYGVFYPDGSVNVGPAKYKDKEEALNDGVDIAEIEIRTLLQED